MTQRQARTTYHCDMTGVIALCAVEDPDDIEERLRFGFELAENSRLNVDLILLSDRVKGIDEELTRAVCDFVQEILDDKPLVLGRSSVEVDFEVHLSGLYLVVI